MDMNRRTALQVIGAASATLALPGLASAVPEPVAPARDQVKYLLFAAHLDTQVENSRRDFFPLGDVDQFEGDFHERVRRTAEARYCVDMTHQYRADVIVNLERTPSWESEWKLSSMSDAKAYRLPRYNIFLSYLPETDTFYLDWTPIAKVSDRPTFRGNSACVDRMTLWNWRSGKEAGQFTFDSAFSFWRRLDLVEVIPTHPVIMQGTLS